MDIKEYTKQMDEKHKAYIKGFEDGVEFIKKLYGVYENEDLSLKEAIGTMKYGEMSE